MSALISRIKGWTIVFFLGGGTIFFRRILQLYSFETSLIKSMKKNFALKKLTHERELKHSVLCLCPMHNKDQRQIYKN